MYRDLLAAHSSLCSSSKAPTKRMIASSLVVGLLLTPAEPIHHYPLGIGQNAREEVALRYAVMSREAFKLSLGLDCDNHVDAFALTVNVVEVPLAIGGLACGIALR